jgi:hypothetical protein
MIFKKLSKNDNKNDSKKNEQRNQQDLIISDGTYGKVTQKDIDAKRIKIIQPKDMDKAIDKFKKYDYSEERKKPINDGYGEWIPFIYKNKHGKIKVMYLRSLGTNHISGTNHITLNYLITHRLKSYIRSIKKKR